MMHLINSLFLITHACTEDCNKYNTCISQKHMKSSPFSPIDCK